MKRYIEKTIVPFISQKRQSLYLPTPQPIILFDCFRIQTTPDILSLLEKHNINAVQVPSNCTDKLPPVDISVNKPVKDEIKKRFQCWEVQKQLKEIPLGEVKMDVAAAAALEERPEVAINGFKKSGIYDAVTEVTKDHEYQYLTQLLTVNMLSFALTHQNCCYHNHYGIIRLTSRGCKYGCKN